MRLVQAKVVRVSSETSDLQKLEVCYQDASGNWLRAGH